MATTATGTTCNRRVISGFRPCLSQHQQHQRRNSSSNKNNNGCNNEYQGEWKTITIAIFPTTTTAYVRSDDCTHALLPEPEGSPSERVSCTKVQGGGNNGQHFVLLNEPEHLARRRRRVPAPTSGTVSPTALPHCSHILHLFARSQAVGQAQASMPKGTLVERGSALRTLAHGARCQLNGFPR